MTKNNALIIDDDVLTGRNLEFALKQLDYENTHLVSTTQEGLSCLEEALFNIVFINTNLQDESGEAFLRIVQNKHSTPCVYVTDYQGTDTYETLLTHNPSAILIKPFTQKEVEMTVKQIQFRVQKEKELSRKELWMNAVFHNITDAIIVVDQDEKITFLNASAENLLCGESKTLLGLSLQNYLTFCDEDSRRYEMTPFTKVLRRQTPSVEKNIYITDSLGKTIPINCSTSPMMDGKTCIGAVIGIHFISKLVTV